jgi:hypothetical protein
MLSASARFFVFTVLVAICSHPAAAATAIPDSVAVQQSFCLWPASTIPPGKRVSGNINGYHITCVGGTNRVVNSNTVPCDGALGIHTPGTPRVCSGYKVSTAEKETPTRGSCSGVVGSWAWAVAGAAHGRATFFLNHSAIHTIGGPGQWSCSNGQYTVTWSNHATDRFTVEGSTLSGTSSVLGLPVSASRL